MNINYITRSEWEKYIKGKDIDVFWDDGICKIGNHFPISVFQDKGLYLYTNKRGLLQWNSDIVFVGEDFTPYPIRNFINVYSSAPLKEIDI